MNKIIMDKDYYHLNNEELNIKITKKNITIEIDGKVIINDFDTIEDTNIKLILNDNSNLIYNKFNKDISNINVDIIVNNNTYLEFNESLYETIESICNINTNILGNDNKSIINFYGVTNQKGSINVKATGDINKNITNNDMLENIRILSLNDTNNVIIPNLLVSSDEVNVNHNATISGIDNNYLFYLESKGLNKEEAINLIYKGFLISKLNIKEEEKENIKF